MQSVMSKTSFSQIENMHQNYMWKLKNLIGVGTTKNPGVKIQNRDNTTHELVPDAKGQINKVCFEKNVCKVYLIMANSSMKAF